jgi:biotin-[acetyl-CoA-carboxylase] ligase BirA-like protein
MGLSFTILRYDSLASTNTEAARQAARGAPEGLCVVAREQTAGRGRQQRRWASPRDAGLYFSVVLRPRFDPARRPLITLAAALAVCDALSEACSLEADIKWPNDLLARGRKLCGILAETAEAGACVLGVGVNLSDRAFPPELAGLFRSSRARSAAGTRRSAERTAPAAWSKPGSRAPLTRAARASASDSPPKLSTDSHAALSLTAHFG